MSDYDFIVIFRRERTYMEFDEAVKGGTPATDLESWIVIGETMMSHPPQKGEFIWINDVRWYVADRSWKIHLEGSSSIDKIMLSLTKSPESGRIDYGVPGKPF